MGLFDVLKKKNSDTSSRVDNGVSRLIGDLSSFESGRSITNIKMSSIRSTGDKSYEPIIFMSNLDRPSRGWECHDCGTINAFSAKCCDVCGTMHG